MRAHTWISILVASGAAAVAGWGLAAPKPGAVFADNSPSAIPVDVELVIAVDVSNSMDPEEQALQREGYILGLTAIMHEVAHISGLLGERAAAVRPAGSV